jgi:hypothetical protein
MRSTAHERQMLFQRAGERRLSPQGSVAAYERHSIVPNS